MTQRYVRLTRTKKDFGILVKPEEVDRIVDEDRETEHYESVYYYNEDHLKRFNEVGSIRGITDVLTDKLVFDFDSKQDITLAQSDALEAISRLGAYGINDKEINIFFSGYKGFTISVTLPKLLSPKEIAYIAIERIGKGLPTLDSSIYNASRVLRVPGTKHTESGLYKIPLSKTELQYPIETIKEIAKDVYDTPETITSSPSEELFKMEKVEKKVSTSYDIGDISRKPYKWSNCKWSLLQGNFKSGERDQVMIILAATCRGLGYDRETTYYICKSALKKSWAKHGEGGFTKEELWNNIINNNIFADTWTGGQYSCTTNPWLKQYCEALGDKRCKDKEKEDNAPSVSLQDSFQRFFKYAKDFEKNKIKTGIKEIDDNVHLCASTLVGLLGQPGSGKTSISLQILKNTSSMKINSMFFSMDMAEPIVNAKMVQSNTGYNYDKVMKLFQESPEEAEHIAHETIELYKNMSPNYRAGLTVADIRDCISRQNEKNGPGNEVKLVVVDYLECISGPSSDENANTGFIANQLKDVANELEVCILLLLQTQKHSTPDVSDPLLSLKGVKGSSLIEQACSVIITLWRDGYSPNYTEHDKYISFASVKNRFGSLWKGDFAWDGVRGMTASLMSEQRSELHKFRELKKEDKARAAVNSSRGWE